MYLTHLAPRRACIFRLPNGSRCSPKCVATFRGAGRERRLPRDPDFARRQAEREAVLAFGPVGRMLGRELRATHPIAWGKRRWVLGLLMGAVVPWTVSLVSTYLLCSTTHRPPSGVSVPGTAR